MKCPCCKEELKAGILKKLETLMEHVFDTNSEDVSYKASFDCHNKDCQAMQAGCFWDEDGALYCDKFLDSSKVKWINDNNGAFGSFERQLNVECRKHDEDRLFFTIPCWPLKNWKVFINYEYKSNEEGDIVSRKRKYQFVNSEGFVHIWGIKMLLFCCKKDYRSYKELKTNPESNWAKNDLICETECNGIHNPEWWRKGSAIFAKILLRLLK